MKLAQNIKSILTAHPHWGPKRIAEEVGTSPRVVSVTASKAGIKFMDTRDIEDWVDGEILRLRQEGP